MTCLTGDVCLVSYESVVVSQSLLVACLITKQAHRNRTRAPANASLPTDERRPGIFINIFSILSPLAYTHPPRSTLTQDPS